MGMGSIFLGQREEVRQCGGWRPGVSSGCSFARTPTTPTHTIKWNEKAEKKMFIGVLEFQGYSAVPPNSTLTVLLLGPMFAKSPQQWFHT